MYIVEHGEVDVYTTEVAGAEGVGLKRRQPSGQLVNLGVRLGRLGENCYFGELSLMKGALKQAFRVRTVTARCTCKLALLRRQSVDALRREFVKLDRIMSEVEAGAEEDLMRASPRLASATKSLTPPAKNPLDVQAQKRSDAPMGTASSGALVVNPELQEWLGVQLRKMEERHVAALHDLEHRLVESLRS
eukprot:SAG11_NODE_97_length_16960_cov_22.407405_3_plen_190_part_00